jgi:transcriptional/translational regulatory protein YebC/TACO1
VRAKLEAAGFRSANAEATMSASTTVKLEGDDAQKMVALADALEDLDDVQSVYANFDISDEEMARLA